MIQKIRKTLEIIIATVVLVYAVLLMFNISTFTFLLPYFFLVCGLIYFVVELSDRQAKKPIIKIILLIVSIILIAFAVKIILDGTTGTSFLTLFLLAIILSSFEKRFSPSDQKA